MLSTNSEQVTQDPKSIGNHIFLAFKSKKEPQITQISIAIKRAIFCILIKKIINSRSLYCTVETSHDIWSLYYNLVRKSNPRRNTYIFPLRVRDLWMFFKIHISNFKAHAHKFKRLFWGQKLVF